MLIKNITGRKCPACTGIHLLLNRYDFAGAAGQHPCSTISGSSSCSGTVKIGAILLCSIDDACYRSRNILIGEDWQPPRTNYSMLDFSFPAIRCSVTTITSIGIYQLRTVFQFASGMSFNVNVKRSLSLQCTFQRDWY